ncbi:DC-STAMP domain-containing protein 2 [Anableps anableps]
MGPQEERHLLNGDITVQVAGDGATQTFRGHLKRSGGRSRLQGRRRLRAHLVQARRSLAAFFAGLLLASLYGLMGLLLQKQSLWICVYSTVVVAGLMAFGMGLSAGVRASIVVMLPTMFSVHGRRYILLLYVSVLMSGPLKNTMENTERAASSLLCSTELAANQTKELMQRAATPLFSALDEIRKISRNAYAVAGRVQNFINALLDSVRHVARTLRNVLHFLVDIGDICNDNMGAPYRKCLDLFAQARSDCSNLLREFNFLCEIVNAFTPLCNLARAGEMFCIIPSYVATHLKQRLAEPTIAAFKKMLQQFDFNITASVQFDLGANSSRTLQQVSQEIMAEISSELEIFKKLSEPLVYGSLILLGWSFLRAVMYRRKYLRDLSFDNFYINAQFKELDQQVASKGGVSVLPLRRKEAQTYVTPLSLRLTHRERRALLGGVASVLRHLAVGGLLAAVDFLVFWVLDQVYHQVKADVVARAPMQVAVRVNGSGYASDIFRDLVASFDVLQRGNVTVISTKCLVGPLQPDKGTNILLGFLLGLALIVSLSGGFVRRLRRVICAAYYPEREQVRKHTETHSLALRQAILVRNDQKLQGQERANVAETVLASLGFGYIHFLHCVLQERLWFLRQQILKERTSLGRALRRSTVRHLADRDKGGGGSLQALLMRIPGGRHLSHLLDCSSSLTCLGCGEAVRAKDGDTVVCDVPRCSGGKRSLRTLGSDGSMKTGENLRETLAQLQISTKSPDSSETENTSDIQWKQKSPAASPRLSLCVVFPGVFCRPCFHSLGNMCAVCMRPLTFQEDGEEELDSSDDEQLSLWSAALDSSHITDQTSRMLMRRRISTARSYQEPASGGVAGTSEVQSGATNYLSTGLREPHTSSWDRFGFSDSFWSFIRSFHRQEVALTDISVQTLGNHGDQ